MVRSKTPVNPFYVLLVVCGIAFTLTACAYSVMALKATRGPLESAELGGPQSAAGTALLEHLDRYGPRWMAVEIGLLCLATLGAIGTDHYRQARAGRAVPPAGDRPGA